MITSKFLPKGFTLIELLVVIAIIGVLSSIVLASLNSTRAKANDAAIKANLTQIRTQSELVYNSLGCYGDLATGAPGTNCAAAAFVAGACAATADTLFAEPGVTLQITAAGNASNGTGIGRASCVSSANQRSWAISVPLRTDATKSFCADSTGVAREVTPAGGDLGFLTGACK